MWRFGAQRWIGAGGCIEICFGRAYEAKGNVHRQVARTLSPKPRVKRRRIIRNRAMLVQIVTRRRLAMVAAESRGGRPAAPDDEERTRGEDEEDSQYCLAHLHKHRL